MLTSNPSIVERTSSLSQMGFHHL